MATREPLRETTGNSTASATTRTSATPAKRGEVRLVRMGPQELREWQRQWKRILAKATLYFDCVDNQSIARVQPTLRKFGSTIDRFFSVKVTHVVTTRALEGKYPPGDVLQKAFAENMKIWTYDKLLRFLGYMLQKPSTQQSQQHQDKLEVMLRQEKVLGPNDRDPTARREDYHYFKGPYLLVWDPSTNYRPLMHKEYEKDGAPRLHLSSSSKCPFQEDERKRKRADDNAAAQPKAIKTSANANATTVHPQDLIRQPGGTTTDARPRGQQVRITDSQATLQRPENDDVKRAADLRQREVKPTPVTAVSRPKTEIKSTSVLHKPAVNATVMTSHPEQPVKTSAAGQPARAMATTSDQIKPTTVNQTERGKTATTSTDQIEQGKTSTATAADQIKTATPTENPETITVHAHRENVKQTTELPERAKARPADAHKQTAQAQESTGPVRRGIWDKPTNNNDQSHQHHQSKFNEIAASGIKPSMTSAARSVVQSGTTDGGGNGLGAPTTQIASKEVNHLKKRVLSKLPPQKTQTAPSNTNKKEEKDPSEEKKKQGWCENCQQRYDRLQDHIKTSRHIRYATDPKHFVELDHLLHSLRRQEKQNDKSAPRTPEAQLASNDPQTPPTHPLSPTPSPRKQSIYM
jgi:hypothetical protein